MEYEVYWTKCETDEESPDAYIPGLTQNKFKPWQFGEVRTNPAKSKSRQKRMESEEEDLSMKGKDRPSLKDLRPEDKTRIANLIRELAKTGREKDNATNELESERKKYELQEQQSKQQLKLLAKERDTVKQHYIKCQQLLAQYQNELKEEQMKVAEAVQKAVKQKEASHVAQEMTEQKAQMASQAAQEMAEQKAHAAQMAAENERKMAEKKAAHMTAEKERRMADQQSARIAQLAAEKQRRMADQKVVWTAQVAAEKESFATDYAGLNGSHNLSALRHSLNSRQPLRKLSRQSHNIQQQSVGPSQGLHPHIPVEGQFYPAMASTNRSQHVEGQFYPAMTSTNRSQHVEGQFYPAMTSTNRSQHLEGQFYPPKTSTNRSQHVLPQNTKEFKHQSHQNHLKDPHDHWSINEVTDPRRSVEEFHALEAQVDDTPPTFEEEFTPMSPVQRQEYNDNAPQYRQSYIRMTPEQRWNELLLHREKLHDEQDWLRRKLQEQEELLQQRDKEKTHKHGTHDPLIPVHFLIEQNQEPGSRHAPHHHKAKDKISSSNRSIHSNRASSGKMIYMESHPRMLRDSAQSNQQDDRTIYSEPNKSTSDMKGNKSQNRRHLIAQHENDVHMGKESHHMPPSNLSVLMNDKGCSPICVDRETQTLLKEKSVGIKVPSERRVFDDSRSRKDVTRYMENTSLLKDIVDTVEGTRISRFDSPVVQRDTSSLQDPTMVQRHPLSSVQRHPSFQRDPPPVHRRILSPMDPSRNMFPSPDLFDIPCDEEIDKIEESQILQDIFFLK